MKHSRPLVGRSFSQEAEFLKERKKKREERGEKKIQDTEDSPKSVEHSIRTTN